MRVRDLKWYILLTTILLISYAAVALCYYLPIRAKVEDSMSTLGKEAVLNTTTLVEDRLIGIYDEFILKGEVLEDDKVIVDTSIYQTGARSKFDSIEGKKILFETYKNFAVNDSNDEFYGDYFFFIYDEARDVVGRVSPSTLFDSDLKFKSLLVSPGGGVIYTKDFRATGLHQIFTNFEFDSSVAQGKDNWVLRATTDERAVFSIKKLSEINVYVATYIPITDPYLAIDYVIDDALVFYISGVAIVVLIAVIYVFACRRASKLLRVDRYALNKTKAIVIRIDNDGNVIFTNKIFKRLYGVKAISHVNDLKNVNSHDGIFEDVKGGKTFECELPLNGEMYYFQLSPIYLLKSYYLTGCDITIDFKRRMHLEMMCGKNEITNCDNSFTLTNQYQYILSSSGSMNIAFIEYNIHKYEEVIGVFGRENYNTLLMEYYRKLTENYVELRIYQLDDSNFIVVYPYSTLEEVTGKIEETVEVFKRPINVGRNNIYVTSKIVVYNLLREQSDEITLTEIKNKLDLALKNIADFSSKSYIIYEPIMDASILAQEEMERDLQIGLKENEFRMFLQPQFDVVSNVITGFEALIRWNNPKYMKKSPQVFIELAERRGYMLDVGRFVLNECFRLAKLLEPYGVQISVNVSPVQIVQVGFVSELLSFAKLHDVSPSSIAIEITETLLMSNFKLVADKLNLLKANGFKIHLDDFCTGYSSMLYLKELPVDTIKIDKDFVKYITTNKVHENIVKTITQLGVGLNLGIVCEGVETQDQSDMVKKFGCRVIQGWLIGKAMPYEEALELLEKYNSNKEGRKNK